jgi:hypothetical protein
MMMTLKKMLSWFREHVRAFLGIDSLPTRSETIALRDDLAKYHREVIEAIKNRPNLPVLYPGNQAFNAPSISWEMVQAMELANMIQNPPKED